MELRKAKKQEIDTLKKMAAEAFDRPLHYFDFLEYRSPWVDTLVLAEGAEIIGMVTVRKERERFFLSNLCIAPALQGRGFGRRMMTAIEEYYKNTAVFELDAKVINAAANAVYRKAGYKEQYRFPVYDSYRKRRFLMIRYRRTVSGRDISAA